MPPQRQRRSPVSEPAKTPFRASETPADDLSDRYRDAIHHRFEIAEERAPIVAGEFLTRYCSTKRRLPEPSGSWGALRELVALPYPWIMRNLITIKGRCMYSPAAVPGMVGLIRGGLLDLEHFHVTEFGLDDVNNAITHASAIRGSFNLTVPRGRQLSGAIPQISD